MSDQTLKDAEKNSVVEEVVEVSIKRYNTESSDAFLTDLKKAKVQLVLDKTDPVKDIEEVAASVARAIVGHDIPVTSLRSSEFVDVSRHAVKQLTKSAKYKVFFAAADQKMFEDYFPESSKYYSSFKQGNSAITSALLKKFPCLITEGKIVGDAARELGYVVDAIIEVAEKNQKYVRREAGETFRLIELLINHWKGTKKDGLKLIIEAIKNFHKKYATHAELYKPEYLLVSLFLGFNENDTEQIDIWFNKTFGKDIPDPKKAIEAFMEVRASIKPDPRAEITTLVDEDMYLKFTALLKKKKCEDEFWEVSSLEDSKDSTRTHVHTANGKLDGNPQSWEEKAMTMLFKAIAKRPELCPNCLNVHDLKDCDEIDKSGKENLGAFLVKDFAQKAKVTARCPPYLSRCAKRANIRRTQGLTLKNENKQDSSTDIDVRTTPLKSMVGGIEHETDYSHFTSSHSEFFSTVVQTYQSPIRRN